MDPRKSRKEFTMAKGQVNGGGWPGQLLAENRAPVRRSAMNLEDLLCQVDADDANLIHGCLLWFEAYVESVRSSVYE
jgi:hypothetical protein